MRLIVSGSSRYADYAYLDRVLTRFTWEEDEVYLVAGMIPGKEHKTFFPLPECWMNNRFRKGHRGFRFLLRYYPEYEGRKKWSKGVEEMRLKMVQEADALVAFLDVGADDHHTKELVRLAKFYDLKTEVHLV